MLTFLVPLLQPLAFFFAPFLHSPSRCASVQSTSSFGKEPKRYVTLSMSTAATTAPGEEKSPLSPTIPTIIGIAVGGAVLLVAISLAIIISLARKKHKTQLAISEEAGRRRLSKSSYAAAHRPHMSITDNDVARMPGYSHRPHNSSSTYTRMAERKTSKEEKSNQAAPRLVTNDQVDGQSAAPSISWPLPRRLTRCNAAPPPAVQHARIKSTSKMAERMPVSAKTDSPDVSPKSRSKPQTEPAIPVRDKSPMVELPNEVLQHKPFLSYGQPRSASYTALTELARKVSARSRLSRAEEDGTETSAKRFSRQRLPRTSSLWCQDPGTAPVRPVPALPIQAHLQHLTSSVTSPELGSGRFSEIFSDHTSILDSSTAFSDGETTLTSRSHAPQTLPESHVKSEGMYDNQGMQFEMTPGIEEETKSPTKIKTFLDSSKSQRDSQGTLPRSNSSGITPSWLDHKWSRNASSNTLHKDGSVNIPMPSSAERRRPRRGVSPSPLRNSSTLPSHTKHAPTSVLQAISGNQRSPKVDTGDKRPISIAASEQFEWDPELFMQSRSSIRLSKFSLTFPQNTSPKFDSIAAENNLTQYSPKAPSSLRIAKKRRQSNFRPPSTAVFDFSFQPHTLPQQQQQSSPAEPPYHTPHTSFSTARTETHNTNDNGSNGSSSPSPISTPSHKPRHHYHRTAAAAAAAAAPIRFSPKQSYNSPALRRNSTSPSKFPLPPTRHPSHKLPPSLASQNTNRINSSTTHASKIPIRGPRNAPPARYHTRHHQRPHSPTKGINKPTSSHVASVVRGRKQRHQHTKTLSMSNTVGMLRRMNSEAAATDSSSNEDGEGVGNDGAVDATPGKREHRRYLSLGEGEGELGELEIEGEGAGGRQGRGGKGEGEEMDPLSWTPDTAYVPAARNPGSVPAGFDRIEPGIADAQVHDGLVWLHPPKSRGYTRVWLPFHLKLHRSFHLADYGLYYLSLRRNAAARVRGVSGGSTEVAVIRCQGSVVFDYQSGNFKK